MIGDHRGQRGDSGPDACGVTLAPEPRALPSGGEAISSDFDVLGWRGAVVGHEDSSVRGVAKSTGMSRSVLAW